MTASGTFPSVEVNQNIQKNIVAARYDVARLTIGQIEDIDNPGGLQTFRLNSTSHTSVKFVNTTNETISDLSISLKVPRGWKSKVTGTTNAVRKVGYQVEPGQTVVVDFTVTSSGQEYNGDIKAVAEWTGANGKDSWSAVQKYATFIL